LHIFEDVDRSCESDRSPAQALDLPHGLVGRLFVAPVVDGDVCAILRERK
jgi:hypothetical protein